MCRLESPPETMVQGGLPLSRDAIYSLLQVCIKEKDLAGGRLAHSLMVRGDLDGLVVLGDHLIRLFAACGSLLESNLVFCMVSKPSVYTWQAIISAHATMGEHEKALHLYNNMQQEGVEPGEFVFSSILKACGGIGSIEQGRSIHDHIIVNGLESNLVLGSSLVDMYVKCGHLVEARSVFDFMPTKNIVSWSAMMAGYVQHGCGLPALELFEAMQEEGIRPDKVTLLCTLQACGCVGAVLLGRVMHEEIIRNIFTPDAVIGNALVHMYAKCGSLEEALNVFNKLLAKTVVSYGAMISGYTQHGHDIVAMELFRDMLREGIEPNEVLFLCLLKACGSRGAINVGRLIHIQIIESQLEPDVVIGSALIDMYAKCGSLKESHNVLLALPCRDVVSWGVIISGYSQHGYGIIALELFKEMQKEGIKPDEVTLLGVLKACGSMSGIQQARLIHGQIAENGLESDTALGNALVDTYLRCGSIEEAMKTLDRLPNRNMVTWNTVIAVCTHHGHDLSAIEIFKTMQQDCVKPDIFTFSILLKTCGSIGAIEQGKQIHEQMLRTEHELDLVIGTTLVDMYAKCGYLKDAHKILDGMPHRDVVSWNALIAGYTQRGNCKQAVQCFKNLQKQGLKPDAHTYASILAACSHVGALEEAHHYFTSMTDHGITPGIEHLNSMTDLLGRLGHLDEAEKLVGTMPDVADIVSWRSLLTSCRTYGDSNLGRQCFDQAVTLRPNSAAGYVLMSNIYADAQRWDDVDDIQDQKTSADASKKPGRAWIEVGNKVQEFTVGDKSHIASERICLKLQNMRIQLTEKGYLPQSGFLCGAESKQRSNRCIM